MAAKDSNSNDPLHSLLRPRRLSREFQPLPKIAHPPPIFSLDFLGDDDEEEVRRSSVAASSSASTLLSIKLDSLSEVGKVSSEKRRQYSNYSYASASSWIAPSGKSTQTLLNSHDNPPRYQLSLRPKKKWHGHWSTRERILLITGVIILAAIASGVAVSLRYKKIHRGSAGLTPTWRPALGNTWQIQLNTPVTNPSLRASVYNIDLFNNNEADIANLHQLGRRVICHFSAGTHQDWTPDVSQFSAKSIGNTLSGSSDRWLDTRRADVRSTMTARIKLAQDKGCDGVDPDHIDGYDNNSGFPLTVANAVDYIKFLSHTSHVMNLAIGLKNGAALVNQTLDMVDWELNESCVGNNECDAFQPFIQAGKPVFHIEYSDNATVSVLDTACNAAGTKGFSTLIKRVALDNWALDCPFGVPSFGGD